MANLKKSFKGSDKLKQLIEKNIEETIDQYITAQAEAYAFEVFGQEVYSNSDFSEDVSACKQDFIEGASSALGLSKNLIPRPPHPNRPR